MLAASSCADCRVVLINKSWMRQRRQRRGVTQPFTLRANLVLKIASEIRRYLLIWNAVIDWELCKHPVANPVGPPCNMALCRSPACKRMYSYILSVSTSTLERHSQRHSHRYYTAKGEKERKQPRKSDKVTLAQFSYRLGLTFSSVADGSQMIYDRKFCDSVADLLVNFCQIW